MVYILVIEDEDHIRENVVETLMLNDFDVVDAENGSMGIDMIRNHSFDVIVCDIMMYGIDGFEVLRVVREELGLADLPFIFLTALADKESRKRANEMGVDEFITKPFSNQELLLTITNLLKRITS